MNVRFNPLVSSQNVSKCSHTTDHERRAGAVSALVTRNGSKPYVIDWSVLASLKSLVLVSFVPLEEHVLLIALADNIGDEIQNFFTGEFVD